MPRQAFRRPKAPNTPEEDQKLHTVRENPDTLNHASLETLVRGQAGRQENRSSPFLV